MVMRVVYSFAVQPPSQRGLELIFFWSSCNMILKYTTTIQFNIVLYKSQKTKESFKYPQIEILSVRFFRLKPGNNFSDICAGYIYQQKSLRYLRRPLKLSRICEDRPNPILLSQGSNFPKHSVQVALSSLLNGSLSEPLRHDSNVLQEFP